MADETTPQTPKKYKYQYVGEGEVGIPEVNLVVKKGEKFESPVKLNNPLLKLLK